MTPLQPRERAASLLLDLLRGKGFVACPFYPGNTIRKAFTRLDKLGFLHPGTNTPNALGGDFVAKNKGQIPLSPI